VAALLDHLKIPSADLIGYSMGVGDTAEHGTHHADGAHAHHRPDGERLFRCKTAKAIK
jgi:hypothetical protein